RSTRIARSRPSTASRAEEHRSTAPVPWSPTACSTCFRATPASSGAPATCSSRSLSNDERISPRPYRPRSSEVEGRPSAFRVQDREKLVDASGSLVVKQRAELETRRRIELRARKQRVERRPAENAAGQRQVQAIEHAIDEQRPQDLSAADQCDVPVPLTG